MGDIDVCRSSNTHNNMICLSCHGPNDLTLGYVSRDSSLIIGQLAILCVCSLRIVGILNIEQLSFQIEEPNDTVVKRT